MTDGRMLMKVLIFIAAYLMFAATAAPAKPLIVTAEGKAGKTDDGSGVKEKAVATALTESIVKAVGSFMKEEERGIFEALFKENLYPDATRYILTYRIISEEWKTEPVEKVTPFYKGGLGGIKDIPPGDFDSSEIDGTGNDGFGADSLDVYYVVVEASVDMDELQKDVFRLKAGAGASDTALRVVILGSSGYKSFDAVKEEIRKTEGVKGVDYDSFSKGRIILR
ncbi:MAG: hypothetical protein WA162_01285, partial [Thermodesulfobacteriota bacterium]